MNFEEGIRHVHLSRARIDASPSNDLSLTKSPHHGVHPVAALTTRSTLSTRFMLVKKCQPCNGLDNIALLVHNDYSSSSKTSLSCYQCIKVHKNVVANLFGNKGSGRTARNDAKQVVPSTDDVSGMSL